MYQYTTFFPLAGSKSYFTTLKQCTDQLRKSIRLTNEFRKNRQDKKEKPVSNDEIFSGQRLLKLDISENERVLEILGTPKELSVQNLERAIAIKEQSL